MVFTSISFLFFFLPITLAINFLCPKVSVKNFALLILSLLFYAWGEPVYVFLMIISIVINYFFGLGIAFSKNSLRKILLFISVVIDFLILFYFKYFSFCLEIFAPFLKLLKISPLNSEIILPIGISFYTFQIVSYIVDVYRNPETVQKNPFYLGLYISFFPQLIAGPIVRYHDINQQIYERNADFEKILYGVERFIIGFGKKVLLANVFALYADSVLNLHFSEYSTKYAWFSMIAYSLQIFFDFSGYSDMAIGLGSIFGFKFAENFNYPYAATSITDFWRRWHISLSSWFREYLYIPLGGNRKGNFRTYFNIFIVFLATGIWHGASFSFIVWGLGHGFLRICERILSGSNLAKRFLQTENSFLRIAFSVFRRLYALLSVLLLWVFFRNELSDSVKLIMKMFGINYMTLIGKECVIENDMTMTLFYNYKAILVFIVGIAFAFPWWKKVSEYFRMHFSGIFMILKYIFLVLILFFSISSLMNSSYNPFIYFRF